jgi:hypothetical protein
MAKVNNFSWFTIQSLIADSVDDQIQQLLRAQCWNCYPRFLGITRRSSLEAHMS